MPPPLKTAPRLVDDLIPTILEIDDHWWPRDLQRLALVSPSWVGPIRRRLYAFPTLRSFHSCTLLVRTLTQNPHLLALVRGLDLRPIAGEHCALTERDMASLRFLLNLKGLQEVTLGGELAVQAERFIYMMASTRSIRTLHVDGSQVLWDEGDLGCKHPASLQWNEAIAFRFTGLHTLRLSNIQLSVSDPPMPYMLRVKDLILDDVTLDDGSIQDLFHESWASLRHLTITSAKAPDSDELVRELLECCENLESLRYECANGSAHSDMFEDLILPSLRKLCLFDVDVNPQTLALLGQSCRTLEQLAVLGRAVRLSAQEWVDFVRSGAIPSLRVLETAFGNNSPPAGFKRWPEEMRESLVSSCQSRGVVLAC